MKPLAAPSVPGNTDAERMNNAVKKFLSVPKEAYLKEGAIEARAGTKEMGE